MMEQTWLLPSSSLAPDTFDMRLTKRFNGALRGLALSLPEVGRQPELVG